VSSAHIVQSKQRNNIGEKEKPETRQPWEDAEGVQPEGGVLKTHCALQRKEKKRGKEKNLGHGET